MIDKKTKLKDINFDAKSAAEDSIKATAGPLGAAALGWGLIRGRKMYQAARSASPGNGWYNKTWYGQANRLLGEDVANAYRSGIHKTNFWTNSGKATEAGKALVRGFKRPLGVLGLAGLTIAGVGALKGQERSEKRARENEGLDAVERGKYYVVAQDRSGAMKLANQHGFMTKIQANREKEHLEEIGDPTIVYSTRSGDALLNYHGEYFYMK